MATITNPTPEQLKEISDRFIQHHQDIEKIIKSVSSDMKQLFPPFTGIHHEEELLRDIIPLLQKSSDTLYIYSNHIQQILDAVCIADECICSNLFK